MCHRDGRCPPSMISDSYTLTKRSHGGSPPPIPRIRQKNSTLKSFEELRQAGASTVRNCSMTPCTSAESFADAMNRDGQDRLDIAELSRGEVVEVLQPMRESPAIGDVFDRE